MKKHLFIAFSAFVFVFLSAGHAFSQQKPEELLRKRVMELMQAKIGGKWDVVYTFYDSNFRNATSKESFLNRPRKMSFKNITIEKIEILPSGKEAKVEVKSDVTMQGFDFKGAPSKQHWIKEEDMWFQKVNPKMNPFGAQTQKVPKTQKNHK